MCGPSDAPATTGAPKLRRAVTTPLECRFSAPAPPCENRIYASRPTASVFPGVRLLINLKFCGARLETRRRAREVAKAFVRRLVVRIIGQLSHRTQAAVLRCLNLQLPGFAGLGWSQRS